MDHHTPLPKKKRKKKKRKKRDNTFTEMVVINTAYVHKKLTRAERNDLLDPLHKLGAELHIYVENCWNTQSTEHTITRQCLYNLDTLSHPCICKNQSQRYSRSETAQSTPRNPRSLKELN